MWNGVTVHSYYKSGFNIEKTQKKLIMLHNLYVFMFLFHQSGEGRVNQLSESLPLKRGRVFEFISR